MQTQKRGFPSGDVGTALTGGGVGWVFMLSGVPSLITEPVSLSESGISAAEGPLPPEEANTRSESGHCS